ncbi:type II secretion system protein [Fructobacillus sp. M2-14]|uniref:Type II secretion system protein n=1 Tax=Fructobacillus broussonetiae TaxID=2713173 RepID=A0ABS5R063_9LACO|nr:type II secretion system protein [Fructobacillus broussonetiae]MBS9338756.1 type II secretion system protein [Fructobacillus broussonetiae]
MKEKRQAFTLIESLLALLIAAIVFQGLVFLTQWSRRMLETRQREDETLALQVSLNQLANQGYLVESVSKKQIELLSRDGSGPKTLHLKKGQLVLDGDRNGRMVLLGGVKDFCVTKHKTYQSVCLKTTHNNRIEGELLLGERKEQLTDKKE